MTDHHFISYSTKDAQEFALKLCDELEAGPPCFPAWLDKRKLKPGKDWDDQVVEALHTCESVIFIMSRDSVRTGSECKNEWSRALKYKKPVIPVLFHADVEAPLRLGSRQYLDFSGGTCTAFDQGMARLRKHLGWLSSPEGILQVLKDRLADAERESRHETDALKLERIREDIEVLHKDIQRQQFILDNPGDAEARVEQSIERGLERERLPEKPASGSTSTKFINPPPGSAPDYFQNRFVELELMGKFLQNQSERLLVVTGRAGIGKTAMVCRLLKALENGHLPNDLGPLPVDGIVYLGESGVRKVNFPNLFTDLCLLLAEETAKRLKGIYKDPQISTADKTRELLAAFPNGRVAVLLDNFETKLEPGSHDIADAELEDALKTLLDCQQHGVKVIITTRIFPRAMGMVQPGRQFRLDLDKGLESPFAENILKEMDKDGKAGLKTAGSEILQRTRQRTLGNPRALEALFAILAVDRETSLEDILADTERALPELVVEQLVGEAYNRLDVPAQRVMQALALYGRAVTPAAVDYLLQPFLPGVDSAPILNRLLNMHLVRRENKRYYLHPLDGEYALARVPEGNEADRVGKTPRFTRYALLHRGAEYFKKARLPRKEWKTIDHLAPQLAEIELRTTGGDIDTAVQVLLGIDSDYLFLWGHYRLIAQLHEAFQGKISDSELKEESAGNLGIAYRMMGQYENAVLCNEQALNSARARKYHLNENIWLGNLGAVFTEMGQVRLAIEYQEKSLAITRNIDDKISEAVNLSNMGFLYDCIGQTGRAIEFYEKALPIFQNVVEREGEAITLGNIGAAYTNLGLIEKAREYCEKALSIAQKIGARFNQSSSLSRLGGIFIQLSQWPEAVQHYCKALYIADEIVNVQKQNETRYGLALAHLYSGSFEVAHTMITEACTYNYPLEYPKTLALCGLIKLKIGQVSSALEAFSTAITAAETLLGYCQENSKAMDVLGLALCGSALCTQHPELIPRAQKAFQEARSINKDPGYLESLRRLFDQLKSEDRDGLLKGVVI